MKKHLLKGAVVFTCMMSAVLCTDMMALAGTGSTADEDDVVIERGYIDFEQFETDTVISDSIRVGGTHKLSLYAGAGVSYSIADDNGNKVMKIVKGAGVGGNSGFKLINDKIAILDGDNVEYWVIKYNFKNGDSPENYVPYINHHLEFRDDGQSITFNGRQPINEYDWNEYIFIGSRATGKIKLILNGIDCGETSSERIANADNFYGIQVIDMEAKPWERVVYADDIEMYGFDYDVTCDLDGTQAVIPTDRIVLNAVGYVDTASFDTITITSDKDSGIKITDREYNAENASITLHLNKTMEEFTDYTVDCSNVEAKLGGMMLGKTVSFKTTGEIRLVNTVAAGESDRLSKGVNKLVFTAQNPTDVVAEVCMVTEAIKDGKTIGMSYKYVTIPYNSSAQLVTTYQLDGNQTVKAYVKSGINGTVYYGDELTVTKDGIQASVPETPDKIYPSVNTSADAGFYSLVLGENGTRTRLDALSEGGLIDCSVNVGLNESLFITAVKRNGRLVDVVYTKGAGELHNVMNIEDEDCTVEMYAWEDIYGTSGMPGRMVINSERSLFE